MRGGHTGRFDCIHLNPTLQPNPINLTTLLLQPLFCAQEN